MLLDILRNKRGFTILELTLVTLISGVLLALVVPQLKVPYGHYNLESTAYNMAEDIRYFAQQTINAQSVTDSYKIKFDIFNDKYSFQKNTNSLKTMTLPASTDLVWVNFDNYALSFKMTGSPTLVGGTVTLRDRYSGENLYVIVAKDTGRVRVDVKQPASGNE